MLIIKYVITMFNEDYLAAINQELPERWWKAQKT
jgi:hypothetical protein